MTFRVGVIEFLHEGNTFTINRTDINSFKASRYIVGDAVVENLRGTSSAVGGCIEIAEENEWELIPILSAHAQPGGLITEGARLEITNEVTKRLSEYSSFDALFISLHGAMVTETCQDGESQFLKAVREIVGDIPISVTLDLHANIFDEMTGLIDIAVSYRTYPHVDMRERAIEACGLLDRVLRKEIEPKIAIARPPMLVGCDDGRTTDNGPMCRILECAEEEMQDKAILNVAVNAGFIDTDVHAAGPNVLVTYDAINGERDSALAAAQRVCDLIWSYRHDWEPPINLSACISTLESREAGEKPIVVADFSDNPGSGAYSDCTAILSAFIEAGFDNVALGALYDPEAVKTLTDAGVGAEVTLTIGGKTDSSVGGKPVKLTGNVKALSDGEFTYEGPMLAGVPGKMANSVCFHTHGIDVLITAARIQLYDKNMFHAVGIEPAEKSIVVVKSMQHFRGAFAPIADEILVIDAGGLCSPNVMLREYKNLRRPIFPLDEINA